MHRIRLITFVVLLVGVLAFSVGASAAESDGSTIVYAQSIPVTDLGPAYGAFLRYPAGYEVAYVLYDRLVSFDADLNIVPQLAADWEIASDKKTWTFHLRKGVKFHDGTDFNADAVKFNVERMMNPDRNTTNRPLWNPIDKVVVVDDYTVQIITKAPYSMLLNTLAHGSGAIVSPAAIEKYGDKGITNHPVGAGPYELASFNPGQEVVLKAFGDYWGGKPAVDKLVFRYVPEVSTRIAALKTGKADVIDAVPSHLVSQIERDVNLQVLSTPGLRPMGLTIMTQKPPLDNKQVRQALNYAVPKQAMARSIFQGYAQPADAPLAFNTFGHVSIGGYEYNPEKAKSLLADAGWADSDGDGIVDKDGRPLKLTIYTPEGQFPGDMKVVEVVGKALENVGIKPNIVKIEKGGYWDHLRYKPSEIKWDLALFGFNPSNGGGTYHMDSLFSPNPDPDAQPVAWNIARYRNDEVAKLIATAKEAVDPTERKDVLAQAQKIVWDEAPYIWLQVNEIISASRKDVQGVEVWPTIFTVIRNAHK